MNLHNIPEPLNAQERLLYAIVVRQNIMIEQLTSIVEHIAKTNGVATEDARITDVVADVAEKVVEEKPKRAPRKRTVKE